MLHTRFAGVEKLEPRQLLAAHIAGSSKVYATIQAAVNAASGGAVITVDAGTYNELVTVNKRVTLRGAKAGVDARSISRGTGETIVRGALDSAGHRTSAFRLTASDVTLDGFVVQDNSSTERFGAGIVLAPRVAGSRIVNNIVRNNIAGLYLASYSATRQTVIQHNLFQSNNVPGENSGRGIYSDALVSGGNLTNVLIDANKFVSNSGPVKIEAAIGLESRTRGRQSNITITNNTMQNNGKAVLLFNATNVTIRNNSITSSIDWGSAAVRIEGGVSHVTITANTIYNNHTAGIRIDKNASSGDNFDIKITGNNIYGNSQGGLKIDAGTYVGTLDARYNWWGSSTGPGGDGKGSGNAIFANGNSVWFMPFSTTRIAGTGPRPGS